MQDSTTTPDTGPACKGAFKVQRQLQTEVLHVGVHVRMHAGSDDNSQPETPHARELGAQNKQAMQEGGRNLGRVTGHIIG
jgi:predicted glycoside hydrolase/deacetylase ChbG (UPF0249 family)